MVHDRTRIAVLTRGFVHQVLATGLRIAEIVGADVGIIAVEEAAIGTSAICAMVVQGALIPVFALALIGGVEAPLYQVTPVVGADIPVITVNRDESLALAIVADVAHSAGVAVVARGLVEKMRAPGLRVAEVGGANVCIITVDQLRVDTVTVHAFVAPGARVLVVADCVSGRVQTTDRGIARIGRARIAVFAIDCGSGSAYTGDTLARDRTQVAVITGVAFVRRDERALAGL